MLINAYCSNSSLKNTLLVLDEDTRHNIHVIKDAFLFNNIFYSAVLR